LALYNISYLRFQPFDKLRDKVGLTHAQVMHRDTAMLQMQWHTLQQSQLAVDLAVQQ
jgi:hypothetical protein